MVAEFEDTLQALRHQSDRLDAIEAAFMNHPGAFEAFFMELPLPAWVKGDTGKMLLTNRAYESMYDIAPIHYAGKLDMEAWDTETAHEFSELDLRVIRTGKMQTGIEKVPLPNVEKHQLLFVAKWPVEWHPDGRVAKVAGLGMGSVVLRNHPGG